MIGGVTGQPLDSPRDVSTVAGAESGRRRVVVTGMGAVTPLGLDVASTWSALREGVSGIGPITLFDTSAHATRIAGEVRGFDPVATFGAKQARRSSRNIQFALAAAREALMHSYLDVASINTDVGVCIGSGVGGLEVIEQATRTLDRDGPRRVSPFAAATALIDMAPGMVAIDIGARGPNRAVVTACATGADAIGEAAEWIRRGDAIAVLAGGTEAAITATGMAMFGAARALSTRNDEPARASRPFDRDRDGFVSSEGAAVLVLEDRDHALSRRATVHGELIGHAATEDAYHITAPEPTGDGAIRCIRRALERAGLSAADVGYVNAHGTGTELNDIAETRAIKAAFGDAAHSVPISSTKSMTGHMLGAAGAVEAIVCLLAMRDGFLPPTINLDNPAPECDLDYIPHVGRVASVSTALSTSFGFGGHNACLVFRGGER
jgi:3-oxoacyl-[acyl-carrier-protein] synthase II